MTATPIPLPIGFEEDHPAVAPGDLAPPFEDRVGVIDGRVAEGRFGFSSFASAKLLVVIFSSNRCPTAKAYASRLRELHADFAPRGVQLVLVNSNAPHLYPEEGLDGMIARSAEDGYAFPYLVDAGQQVARAWRPTCTFHAFLLDGARRLRYEGRVDNARLEERVTERDLRNAIDDVLADRPVRVAQTRAFGCALDIV
ncbi:MAG TPA: thioredoxin family protein [Candidatus Limnocylindrales bacterium]|nr:thioredoxin family protein [Candidatus Limnocylindrales bacterium]